ncbi:MAG: phospho-2-dehydro-3-deoxyheptonate aldolase [Vagococcus sp.]
MEKNMRMKKIFKRDGKAIVVALDGFGFSANTQGIDRTIKNLDQLIEQGLDAALVTFGQAVTYSDELSQLTSILRVDATTNVFDNSVPDTDRYFGIEEALMLGCDGVVCMTFPGAGQREATSHKLLSELAKTGAKWRVPVIAETLPFGYPVTSQESNQGEVIATGARLGTEFGADIIKTRFSGTVEDKLIVEKADRPVLALGGPKTDTLSYFKFVKHCMDSGAKGVAVGRNITQDENPIGMVAGLNVIIHKNGSAEEAFETYNKVY